MPNHHAQLLRTLARILDDLADEEDCTHVAPISRSQSITEQPRLLTVPGAAEYLNVSKGTIYRMLREDELPSLQLGSMRRIDVRDLERWVDTQKIKTIEAMTPTYSPLPSIYPRGRGRKKS